MELHMMNFPGLMFKNIQLKYLTKMKKSFCFINWYNVTPRYDWRSKSKWSSNNFNSGKSERKIKGGLDLSGNPIVDISQFVTTYNDSFSFEFVTIENLTKSEREIFDMTNDILNLIDGKPRSVRDIKVSSTMRKDFLVKQKLMEFGTQIQVQLLFIAQC